MRHILQVSVLILSAFILTACFDLVAQSKYMEAEKNSVENMVVLGPDTTSDGDQVTYTIVSMPKHGTLDTSLIPKVSYAPDADYVGRDTFKFKLSDGNDESNVATITITVTETDIENQPPVASITLEGEPMVTVGETVSLSGATSTDDDGSIVNYEWFENDTLLHSGSSYDANLSVGNHTLTLKVTDDQNATGEESIDIVVAALSAS